MGVVAYNGYTAAAKKILLNQFMQMLQNTLHQKWQNVTSMANHSVEILACPGTASAVLALLTGTDSPMKDKNPFETGENAVGSGNPSTATDASDLGYVIVTVTCNDGIVLTTEYDEDEDALESTVSA